MTIRVREMGSGRYRASIDRGGCDEVTATGETPAEAVGNLQVALDDMSGVLRGYIRDVYGAGGEQ